MHNTESFKNNLNSNSKQIRIRTRTNQNKDLIHSNKLWTRETVETQNGTIHLNSRSFEHKQHTDTLRLSTQTIEDYPHRTTGKHQNNEYFNGREFGATLTEPLRTPIRAVPLNETTLNVYLKTGRGDNFPRKEETGPVAT